MAFWRRPDGLRTYTTAIRPGKKFCNNKRECFFVCNNKRKEKTERGKVKKKKTNKIETKFLL
jgi:hypothetical protein